MPDVTVSSPAGLTAAEAGRLLAQHGANVLPRPPVTPAWRRLVDQLVHFFALMLWAAAVLAFVAGLPQLGVAIIVVVVVNAVLAFVEEHRAHRDALVRRLDAVETLGSTTFVCTDKTGTLTRNEMQVVEVWTPAGGARVTGAGYEPTGEIDADADAVLPALRTLARAGVSCSSGRAVRHDDRWVAEGDPMEAALHTFALRVSADGSRAAAPGRRFPFDPRRRRMSVVVDGTLLVKGAPDAVLPRCTGARAAADTALARFTTGGLRVLAIARRRWDDDSALTADQAERDLELLGLVGLEDPPRSTAADAARRAAPPASRSR